MERGDFDTIAVGSALIMDPDWPEEVRRGAVDEIAPYMPEALAAGVTAGAPPLQRLACIQRERPCGP